MLDPQALQWQQAQLGGHLPPLWKPLWALLREDTQPEKAQRSVLSSVQTDRSVRDRQPSMYSALDPAALRSNHLERNGILSCSNSSKMGQLDGTALSCTAEIPLWLKAPRTPLSSDSKL